MPSSSAATPADSESTAKGRRGAPCSRHSHAHAFVRRGSIPAVRKGLLIGFAVIATVAAAWLAWGWSRKQGAGAPAAGRDAARVEPATFVGRGACVKCHEKADALWKGSDHDLAMQPADEKTVLGNFDDTTFTYYGVTSTFHKKAGKFFARTDGSDGKFHDYEIAYTFGVRPLQQYLIAFPGGRYQALNVCWDTRPAKEGGQRWFHLYPNENVRWDDVFHWTGPYQNWNFMCAECHSTNVKKGYQPDTDSYRTTWSELSVSCEACHGPGSAHVAWGEAVEAGRAKKDDPRNGLVVTLKEPAAPTWDFDMQRGIARRSFPRTSHAELETCARCHARRSVVSEDYAYGRPILDTHRPALLDDALYHADGQIKDEVYEYGSFLQSRMYREGVTCSDCHDPHSLKVRVSPDATCTRCHLAEKFATPAHHFHKAGSRGASCVECHMASRKYMVVDPRRDHSFRVPRPDLSVKIGTPNACNRPCHEDRSAKWAADAAVKWWPRGRSGQPHYGEALHAAWAVLPGAEGALARLAGDNEQPGIVRATAAAQLASYLGPSAMETLARALRDPDPLVRMGALGPAPGLPPEWRLANVAPLLTDPVREMRMEAARALAPLPRENLPPPQRVALDAAMAEYQKAQLANGDRAEAHLNLGGLAAEQGRLDEAQREFETALKLNRWFPPAYLSLAELHRRKGQDPVGEGVLRKGLEIAPKSADLHHALGLLLVREKRTAEATDELRRAAELDPDQPRYGYVYAVALQSTGRVDRALAVLKKAHEAHPGDAELLFGLATFSRDQGSLTEAVNYAKKLVEVAPQDPAGRQLLAQLEGGQPQRRGPP